MPPQPPTDPDRIDISLDLVGPGALEAMNALTTQLANMQAHLSQFGGVSPEARAQGQRQTRGSSVAGIVHGGHAYQSYPGQADLPSGTSPYASTAPDVPFGQALHEARYGRGPQPTPPGGGSFADALNAARPPAPPEDGSGLGASTPPDMPTPYERLSRMSFTRRLGEYRRQAGFSLNPLDLIKQETAVVEARENYQRGKRGGGSPETPSLATPNPDMQTPGEVSEGASIPPGMDPQWLRSLKADPARYERAQESFRIPQFGQFTVQDKLNMASDFLTRSATKSYYSQRDSLMASGMSEDEIDAAIGSQGQFGQGTGTIRGYAANLLRMGADNAAQASVVHAYASGMLGRGMGYTATGVQSGYARGDQITIPGTHIGFTIPGAATLAGIRNRINATRLRMQAGITGGQANEIIDALTNYGFDPSRGQGQDIAFDAIAPLVSQGQNPELTTSLITQAMRNGNTSLQDVVKTLDNLGDSAHAARMSLDQYMEGLDQFSEQAEQAGGLKGEGLALGRSVTNVTGLSPQQAGQFLQSPLMAASAMSQYGLMPNELGALGNSAQGRQAFTGSMMHVVDMAMQAAAPFNQDVRDAQGHIIISGKEQQITQAAQFAGIDKETFERLVRNRDRIGALSGAQSAVERFQASAKIADQRVQAAYSRDKQRFMQGGTEAELKAQRQGIPDSNEIRRGANKALAQDWGAVRQQLMAAAPTAGKARADYLKRVEDISSMGSMDDRAREAAKLIGQQARENLPNQPSQNDVRVRFTGQAAKFFEQVQNDFPDEFRQANQGGKPRNDSIISDAIKMGASAILHIPVP